MTTPASADPAVAGVAVVAQEICNLSEPWVIEEIEERIREYDASSDDINARLSDGVRRNYGEFVQGMQQVESVEKELTLIGVLLKNGRRKLKERDQRLVGGSMKVSRAQRKSERLKSLLTTLGEFQDVVKTDARLRECLRSENYCEAIAQYSALRSELSLDRFRQYPGLLGLREGLGHHLEVVKQKLSDGLRVAAVSSEFDGERYEDILKAYSMMAPDQAGSVGKELLRHVGECVVAVSRQCMLAFAIPADSSSPSVWYQKAQLRDLCRSMDPTRFVACTAQLYEYLCDFLYRHQFLCDWHAYRLQVAEECNTNETSPQFRQVLRDVLGELEASKRIVWDRIQQQVSLVLMTSDFQYPGLSEDSFLHILYLTQLLIEEGDAFMADFQPPRGGAGTLSDGRRQFSAPIRNTLKSKAHDYFHSLHYHAWVNFKIAYIDQDSWQRLPVPRSHRLLRRERLRVNMPSRVTMNTASASAASGGDEKTFRPRCTENNPFRNYKAEPMLPSASALDSGLVGNDGVHGVGGGGSHQQAADEIDEHALLQHWIDDNENISLENIGSSMLSNSNRSPVVSSSTVELARLLERYFRMMSVMPQLALDIFQNAVQLIEFYVQCVLCLFVQDKHLRMLLEDLDSVQDKAQSSTAPDYKLYQRHESFLVQRLCPDLRRAILRSREQASSVTLPDSCAANLGVAPPVQALYLMQVASSPKLVLASSLCGLAERCVGVESISSLLTDLRDVHQFLSTLLPRGVAQESEATHQRAHWLQQALERFLPSIDAVTTQLKTFVLSCAARDILEVPDVGRVSLEQFLEKVQALRWDIRDFSQGSPAQPYWEQLRAQIDELARRLPCAGGGSIPYATQRIVWGWMEVRIMRECVELVSKLGRRKSQESLFCLAEDFRSIRNSIGQNFKSQGKDGEEPTLLPADHPLASTVSWSYLDHYLEAHGGMDNDTIVWCKRHLEYPLRLHKALVDYLHGGSQKAHKQIMADLEAYYASYISDECGASPGVRRLGRYDSAEMAGL